MPPTTLFPRLAAVLLAALLVCAGPARAAEDVLVFAAASLADVLEEIASDHESVTGQKVTISAGGSGTLARQIQQGAPADIFLSASPEWMDSLAPEIRVDLLGNRLVLIAPAGTAPLALPDLPDALGTSRLALALPDAVPAGQYAKQALETLDLWQTLEPRLAPADNVRAALAFVALGAAPYGIVYSTDAAADPRVSIVAEIPEDAHDPIRYPLALLSDRPEARAVYDTLLSPEAAARFSAAGFTVLPR